MSDEISTNPVENTVSQVPIESHNQTPVPVEKSIPAEPEAKEPKESKPDKPDLDTAIKRAYEKATQRKEAESGKEPVEKAEKPEPKSDAPSRERGQDGKFVGNNQTKEPSASTAEPADGSGQDGKVEARPSEGRDYSKPPAHFLPRAKEAWGTTNPDVQGEVHRMVQNYENGLKEYKESHENWTKLKDFDQMAKANGTTIPDYIRSIRAIETLLQQNPVAGIERVLQQVGVTPEQYARHILGQGQQQPNGQPQQQRQPQTDPRITQELTRMQQIIQRQEQQFEQMKLEAVAAKHIEPFKADHPRYDELEEDIAFFLNSGKIPSNLSERERLETAYDMAERINPAPSFAPREPRTQASQTRQLDPAGQKSVTGSPSPGLSTTKAPSKDDAKDLDAILRRSLAKATAR